MVSLVPGANASNTCVGKDICAWLGHGTHDRILCTAHMRRARVRANTSVFNAQSQHGRERTCKLAALPGSTLSSAAFSTTSLRAPHWVVHRSHTVNKLCTMSACAYARDKSSLGKHHNRRQRRASLHRVRCKYARAVKARPHSRRREGALGKSLPHAVPLYASVRGWQQVACCAIGRTCCRLLLVQLVQQHGEANEVTHL